MTASDTVRRLTWRTLLFTAIFLHGQIPIPAQAILAMPPFFFRVPYGDRGVLSTTNLVMGHVESGNNTVTRSTCGFPFFPFSRQWRDSNSSNRRGRDLAGNLSLRFPMGWDGRPTSRCRLAVVYLLFFSGSSVHVHSFPFVFGGLGRIVSGRGELSCYMAVLASVRRRSLPCCELSLSAARSLAD